MEKLFSIDWHSAFIPEIALLEIVLRGSIMYLAMYFLLRVFRRQPGSFSLADLLVIMVIADAAETGMAGKAHSVTESLVLIGTIASWDYFLDWLGYSSTVFKKILEPERLKVISNGGFIRDNMAKQMITEDQLKSKMRQNGIEDVGQVKTAFLESDGEFSFIRFNVESDTQAYQPKSKPAQ